MKKIKVVKVQKKNVIKKRNEKRDKDRVIESEKDGNCYCYEKLLIYN